MQNSELIDILLSVCKLLEKQEVEYMIVGGVAISLHGYHRYSVNMVGELAEKPGLDIWYLVQPYLQQLFQNHSSIEGLDHDTSRFENEKSPNPKQAFFKLEFDEFTFDLLPRISIDARFYDIFENKETIHFEKTPIHFMSIHDLIKDKETTGREKDLEDVRQLKEIIRKRK